MKNLNWSFSKVWNDSLEQREDRPTKPRDYMWASELGGAYIDRYLKMKGVEPTNPPNPRSMRKFEAGNLMEWVVGMILKRAGILQSSQEWVNHQYSDLLNVTGRLDYLAGGMPNYDMTSIKELGLPPLFDKATEAIIKYFKEKYPKGLNPTILEIKSCSSFTFEGYNQGNADPKHVLQAYHYMKGKGIKEGHIVYISRDDLRICEIGIIDNPEVENTYKSDIAEMTKIYKDNIQPDKEPEIVFDRGRFSQNYKVAYSGYLTKLYGYKNQMSFEQTYKKKITGWNYTLTRMVKGDRMTDLNLRTIDEIKKTFPNLDEVVKQAKEMRKHDTGRKN